MKFKILSQEFFNRDSVSVAKDLLGKLLVRSMNNNYIIGMIVETEAYTGLDDPASHSFIGKTKRNEVLFGKAGHAYIHNMHKQNLLDIVTNEIGIPASVLIRAIEPIKGLKLMREYREVGNLKNLTNGPGKLCQAMRITIDLKGVNVTDPNSPIIISEPITSNMIEIGTSTRIGISKASDKLLRFYIKGNKFVSR